MTSTPSSSRVQVADLVGRPGSSRPLDVVLASPPGLELSLATVRGGVRVEGVIESVVEGLLLRGEVSAALAMACARCLQPVQVELSSPVVELFEDAERVGEELDAGYELLHDELDLDMLVRDALATSVPTRTLCSEDCAGLCVSCGHALRLGECGCSDETEDPRWAPLRALELS